jgi:hypothetical protein
MRPIRPSPRLRLLAATGILAVGLALPAAALADTTGGAPPIQPAFTHDATITGVSVKVTAKLVANVTVSFTCQPLQMFDWSTGEVIETTAGHFEGGGATVIQAQGKTIAWGQVELFGGAALCDGTTVNTVTAPVTAAVAPWKNGTAVVGASVQLSDANGSDSDYASSGPIVVRLSGK